MSIVRDRALIAVMTGCGLRRFEISDLKITQMKQVQGRWAFTDIKGKGKDTELLQFLNMPLSA